jgi:hypothetical protein
MRVRVSSAAGLTLVEVLIAVALCLTLALGVAQLIAVSTRAVRTAREHAAAVIFAAAKMDELRSLAWTYEAASPGETAIPRSDLVTNISHPDHTADGPGLSESPTNTLSTNTPLYVDYLDGAGRWLGHDAAPPANAVFVRRWAVRPLSADPQRTILLQVLVRTMRDERSRVGDWQAPSGSDALLVSVRTRMGQ